jgi:serine/threonine-protein kinase
VRPAGSVIIAQGDAGDAAYVILTGRCIDYRVAGSTEVEQRTMGPSDVFGETAVLSGEASATTVKAITDVELLVVKREVLSSALGLNSWMGVFVRALAGRLREADERLHAIRLWETAKGP